MEFLHAFKPAESVQRHEIHLQQQRIERGVGNAQLKALQEKIRLITHGKPCTRKLVAHCEVVVPRRPAH